MITKDLTYNNEKIKLHVNDKHELFFDDRDVKNVFDVTDDYFKHIVDKSMDKFTLLKEYMIDENENRLWSKLGIMKLGFFMQDDDILEFIEFLDSIRLDDIEKEEEKELSNANIASIYKNLENKFKDYSKKIENEDNIDMDELQKFIDTFNLFVKTRADILPNEPIPVPTELLKKDENSEVAPKSGLFKHLYNIASKTGGDAMDFASQTRDQAYNFGSQTEKDAFNFAQDSRNSAYDFTMKTEDDAFNFATKMEDDAYNFVSKMADDAYHFASDGMNYGYMFASQGEELGPMANRVLWMASEIGLMSDRIGEMSDRIVHTEHLIINMSVMILNFGLLIDGTIKTIAEAGLNALGMTFDKEVPQLSSSSAHITAISKNVELILTQQHEYDLRVLDNQRELRKITISALDKISLEY